MEEVEKTSSKRKREEEPFDGKIVKKTKFATSEEQLEFYLGRPSPRKYKFLLDDFQIQAILHLEQDKHVLVTAHTSAGKTVIAEYAIAKALESKSRVIYTSPIKALSNQKFREFQNEFGDVGLLTGDVYKNPNATILVMTTEILRNMLYRGSELLAEVSHVIFDEVHYMRDASRGVVWEESIILLDQKIRMVFLSATLSNASDFSNWISHVKQHPCHIVSTDYRPTPLKHYVYPTGGKGLFLVKEAEGEFLLDNFRRAQKSGTFDEEDNKSRNPRQRWKRDQKQPIRQNNEVRKSDIGRLLLLLKEQENLPAIVFTFARLGVEGLALEVFLSKCSFVDEHEQELIGEVFNGAMETLLEEDRELDAVKSMKAMLLAGIGCHHSGLIPVLKEITELLFQEGLVKVLFATETFAMGVNMPAKTVIFEKMVKWDGKEERILTAGEYTQMSGRAGRRGIDKDGICIMFLDAKLSPENCSKMIALEAAPLNSSFRLTYNMLLNLRRVDLEQVSAVIDKSFYKYMVDVQAKKFTTKEKEMEDTIALTTTREDFPSEDKFFLLEKVVEEKMNKIFGNCNSLVLRFLVPGRVVWISVDTATSVQTFGWCIVLGLQKRYTPETYFLDVLANCGDIDEDTDIPSPSAGETQPQVIRVDMKSVKKLSPVILTSLPRDLRNQKSINNFWVQLRDVKTKMKEHRDNEEPEFEFIEGLPILDTLETFSKFRGSVDTSKARTDIAKIRQQQKGEIGCGEAMKAKLLNLKSMDEAAKDKIRKLYREADIAKIDLEKLQIRVKKSGVNKFKKELRSKMQVLRHMGYIKKENDTLTKRAFVACCLDSADEIIMTEMIFDDSFKNLEPHEIPAFVSCFLDLRKARDAKMTTNTKLKNMYLKLRNKVQSFIEIQLEYGIKIDEEKYLEKFQAHMMDPLLAWCEGKSFSEVVKLADTFEGEIIRNGRRVEDILRQLMDAVKAIGNTELIATIKQSLILLRHGLMFSTSLYVEENANEEGEEDDYGYIPEQFIDERFKSQLANLSEDEELEDFLEAMEKTVEEKPKEENWVRKIDVPDDETVEALFGEDAAPAEETNAAEEFISNIDAETPTE